MEDFRHSHYVKIFLVFFGLAVYFNLEMNFSFLSTISFLMIIGLVVLSVYFNKNWIIFIWGFLTGLSFLYPVITALINQKIDWLPIFVDSIFGLLMCIYYCYKLYHKYKESQPQKNIKL